MKFDVVMLTLLLCGIMFLMGATLGSVLYRNSPELNITTYANENIKNISLNDYTSRDIEAKYNQTGRSGIVLSGYVQFMRTTFYQANAAGMEYGFKNNWIEPMIFALGALVLAILYVFGDQLSFLLIPIALVIIIKDWISERLKRGG
jgi:hypothetical protein